MNLLRKTADVIGKAIPNEVSKLNGFANLLNFIPGIGPVLSTSVKAVSAVDNAATAYSDTGDLGPTFSGAEAGFSGRSSDPGRYGSPDWRPDTLTKAGNFASFATAFFPQSGGSALSPNAGISMPGEPFRGEIPQEMGSFDYFKKMLPILVQMAGISDQAQRPRTRRQDGGLMEISPNDNYYGPYRGSGPEFGMSY